MRHSLVAETETEIGKANKADFSLYLSRIIPVLSLSLFHLLICVPSLSILLSLLVPNDYVNLSLSYLTGLTVALSSNTCKKENWIDVFPSL